MDISIEWKSMIASYPLYGIFMFILSLGSASFHQDLHVHHSENNKFNHHVWPLLQLCIHTRWVATADIRVIEEEKPQSTICIISVNISSPREAILIIRCTNPLPSLCHMLTSTSLKQFLWWLDDIVI